MHNHDEKNNSGMMWMMVLCCVLPLLLVGIFGAGGSLGAPKWLIFGGIAVMVVVHFVMMGTSHKHQNEQQEESDKKDKGQDTKNDTNHSGHNCCH